MQIPPICLIERALEVLKHRDPAILVDELKEFKMLGARPVVMPITFPNQKKLTNIERGYLLGLETARSLLDAAADRSEVIL